MAQRLPFVGCPSDGQAGPVKPPSGTPVPVAMNKDVAQKLAYYAALLIGVPAPRGWNCLEILRLQRRGNPGRSGTDRA